MQSPHVLGNQLYNQRASTTTLLFADEAPPVNAFATDGRLEGLDIDPPFIVLFGGLANACRLSSLAMACDRIFDDRKTRKFFIRTIRSIGQSIVDNNGDLDDGETAKLFTASGLADLCQAQEIQRRARSFSAAMNMIVIAHEPGHICLGHTLQQTAVSEEISRNQEREADSFAASVIMGSPFSDHTVAGRIFWWVILTGGICCQYNQRQHPSPRPGTTAGLHPCQQKAGRRIITG